MKKKKKLKSKRNNKALLFIIIFLAIFSYFELNGDIRVGNILNDLLYPITREIKDDLKITLEEEIINENKELKELLNIDKSLSEFNIINATIIERNNSFFLNEMTINKGLIDGIEKNTPVITKNGLIGEISSISLFTSKVKLITNNSYKISVTVNKNNKILSVDNNKIIIRGINEKDNIKVGDKVITSGLQEKYPKGIIIGRINNLRYESNNVGIIADVLLESNIDDIRFVAVLKRRI